MSFDRFEKSDPLTIYTNLNKHGYATTSRHGQSIDVRLHRPIPKLADIKEGDGFVVFIPRNKKSILLIRSGAINDREKIQETLGYKFLTPGTIRSIIGQAAHADAAAIYQSFGRRKPRIRHLHKRR